MFTLVFRIGNEIRHKAMIQSMITQRKKAAEKIQLNFKHCLNSKKYHCLYEKVKNCYSIYPSIYNKEQTLLMRIFIGDQCKQIRVGYCRLRKVFVIDIPKSKVLRTRQLKINYLINNQVIIDSTLLSKYENGQYVNIIDFDAIEKNQEEMRKYLFKCITEYSKRKWSNNESRTTNEDELHLEECEDEEIYCRKEPSNIEQEKTRRYKGIKTVKIASSKMVLEKPVRSTKKYNTVKSDISLVKSILKPSMSGILNGRCINSKKVCFGEVQFSF